MKNHAWLCTLCSFVPDLDRSTLQVSTWMSWQPVVALGEELYKRRETCTDLQTWTWIRMMKVCLLIVAVVVASASAQRGPGGRPKPRCDDGSKPVCADGSRPVKERGQRPYCEDGSTPACADGSQPSRPGAGGQGGGRPRPPRPNCDRSELVRRSG